MLNICFFQQIIPPQPTNSSQSGQKRARKGDFPRRFLGTMKRPDPWRVPSVIFTVCQFEAAQGTVFACSGLPMQVALFSRITRGGNCVGEWATREPRVL